MSVVPGFLFGDPASWQCRGGRWEQAHVWGVRRVKKHRCVTEVLAGEAGGCNCNSCADCGYDY